MFSSLTSLSIPKFGFGQTADAGTAIRIPPVDVHNVEVATSKEGRTLKHLLKLNHATFSILYHDFQFHNHTPHILGSAYLLGSPASHLNDIYDDAAGPHSGHEPWRDSPSEIALHDWRDFLGRKEYQRAFVDFFEDQLVSHGYDWRAVVAEFLFGGAHPLMNCLIGGLGHPLIHLGYAYELNSREVAMEALGLVATCYNGLHKYLDDDKYSRRGPGGFASSNPLEILARIAADPRLDGPPFDRVRAGNLERVFSADFEPVLLEYWNAWKLVDPAKQFEDSQQAAVGLLISTARSVGGQGYDFLLVHLLTTSHAARIMIPFLPSRWHVSLVRQWWLIAVAVYIAQTRPVVRLDVIRDVDLGARDWAWVEKQAVEGKHALDPHFVKAARAIKEAARVWGDKDDFYLKAAVKFTAEFDDWAGFAEDDPAAEECRREQKA